MSPPLDLTRLHDLREQSVSIAFREWSETASFDELRLFHRALETMYLTIEGEVFRRLRSEKQL